MKILGMTITTGSKPEPPKPEKKQKGLSDTLGGWLDFFKKPLSGEKEISDKLIKANEEWVFINVSTLAEVVSDLELQLFQFKMVQGRVELEEIEEHELLDLLDRFNESTTKADAIYNTEAHLDLTGDAFWLLEGGLRNKKPTNIYLLNPDNITLRLGDFTKQASRLIESYDYKITIDQKTIERSYDPSEIIHTKVPNPANPYRGKSVVEALATTIDTDNFAQEALKNLFKNGMIGDFFLTTEKKATPEQLKRLAAQFKAAYTGVRNFWKVPILYGGIKPEKLMSTGREMQLIELEGWFRNKIMSAFKNTRASLGIDDEVNRSTAEASLSNWKRSVVAPKMARIVNSLNEFLVPRYGENLILGFKDPVPEDKAAKIEEASKLYKEGIITKNEARQIIDYDDVDGGDEFKVSLNPLSNNFNDEVQRMIPSLKYVNYKKIFRKAKIRQKSKDYREAYKQALPIAKRIVKNRKKKETAREHSKFTNEQVWNYWSKQIDIVEDIEKIFSNVAEQFANFIVEEGLSNLDDAERRESELVDKDELLERAVNQFTPSLSEVVILSGQLANHLIGRNEPYIPTKAVNIREAVRDSILLFAGSMIDTDVEFMALALTQGLDKGESIPQIRKTIQEHFFGEGKAAKTQAERVTRTEVIKASNLGTQDAFEQSGVVVGKQWLTAEDDRVDPNCAVMNGQIVGLESNYDSTIKNLIDESSKILSYSSVDYPPLHPNCRCTLLPIIEGQEDFDIRSFEVFQDLKLRVRELEGQVDKRTKEFKQAKKEIEEKSKSEEEVKDYIAKLENIAGIGDDK